MGGARPYPAPRNFAFLGSGYGNPVTTGFSSDRDCGRSYRCAYPRNLSPETQLIFENCRLKGALAGSRQSRTPGLRKLRCTNDPGQSSKSISANA